MSTANFVTQDNFPLYVLDYSEITVPQLYSCPECIDDGRGFALKPVIMDYFGDNEYECPRCGFNTDDPEKSGCKYYGPDYDYISMLADDIETACTIANRAHDFWDIALIDGYYTGLQLIAYIRGESEPRNRFFPEDPACYYETDEPEYTQALEEVASVRAKMSEIAESYGMEKYNCIGVFSNGEAVYEYAS